MSRVVAGRVEGRRRSAPEAPRVQPPRTSTAAAQERRRLFAHRGSPSFSDVEFAFENKRGGGGGGRREEQQQQQGWREQERHRPPRYQPRVVDVGCGGVGAGLGRKRSFTYSRLPEHQLRLTVVKLDFSTFDVQVMRSASVLELKLAVEDFFSRLPKGEGPITWSVVWSHFCLCYKDQKLVDDRAYLKAFGIKDEDELHFIRHISINHNQLKQRPRKHVQKKRELMGSEIHQESERHGIDSNDDIKMDDDDYSNYIDKRNDNSTQDDRIPPLKLKPAHSLRGWLSFSGSWSSTRAMLGTAVRLSRLDINCPKAGKK